MELDQAVACLLAGGILIYPTETFYAIGCLATRADAVDLIHAIKARPASSPLPLLAADLEQVLTVIDCAALPAMPAGSPDWQTLADRFWPGPLTLILPARAGLPDAVAPVRQDKNQDHGLNCCQGQSQNNGQVQKKSKHQGPCLAVRVTANPLARQLARLAACPLVSTSANLSGHAPAHKPDQLDPDFLRSLARHCAGVRPCGIIVPDDSDSVPDGGMPSTILAMQPAPTHSDKAQPAQNDDFLPGWRLVRAGAISRQELAMENWQIEY